jgi:hypothetical protein
MTLASLANSFFHRRENKIYGPQIADVKIKPPLFILGHWRSGTTHLHNLLAVDKQFAYPNFFQVLHPHTFLSTEKQYKVFGLLFSPKTRVVDNVSLSFEVAHEDEFAMSNATFQSPYLSWVFPRWEEHYDRYLTLRELSEEEVAKWKTALVLFLKKLTWKYDRPLLLKSPPHTCRIRLLLDMFPDARFIHIFRNPYDVFQSTRRLMEIMLRVTRLQRSNRQHIDARIIQRYKIMYDTFFEERELIPEGRFHEICFEELERDPVGQVKNIYEKLGIPGFSTVQPSLQCYVDRTANYRKSEYSELPPSLCHQIAQAWHQSFETWGYPR